MQTASIKKEEEPRVYHTKPGSGRGAKQKGRVEPGGESPRAVPIDISESAGGFIA
jgi:hypothetical protein